MTLAATARMVRPKIVATILDLLAEDGGPADVVRDVQWVYTHMEHRRIKPEEAPSAGAWAMLHWARGARNQFFEVVSPRAMAAKNRADDDKQRGDEHDGKPVEKMRGILAKLVRTPPPLEDAAASAARKWTCSHGVALTDRQRDDMTRRIVSVVKNYRAAAGSSAHTHTMPPVTSSATAPPMCPRTSWFS